MTLDCVFRSQDRKDPVIIILNGRSLVDVILPKEQIFIMDSSSDQKFNSGDIVELVQKSNLADIPLRIIYADESEKGNSYCIGYIPPTEGVKDSDEYFDLIIASLKKKYPNLSYRQIKNPRI